MAILADHTSNGQSLTDFERHIQVVQEATRCLKECREQHGNELVKGCPSCVYSAYREIHERKKHIEVAHVYLANIPRADVKADLRMFWEAWNGQGPVWLTKEVFA